MPITFNDLQFDNRIIILIDVIGFSESPDEKQVEILNALNNESKRYLKDSGLERDNMISAFIPTGDGFYILANMFDSLLIGVSFVVFALSLRNAILKKITASKAPFHGVKTAIHFGRTLPFRDIRDQINYTGPGMNECARLLSPINTQDVEAVAHTFYSHDNTVIISRAALEKIGDINDLPVKASNEFTIRAKHDRTFICRFLEMSTEHEYQIL